ncbi:adenosylcobinamide-GDP ribazoletransferase [Acidisoma cellulosilytica]|uniref:Adenosylcobinamide-GDP ribazoletransferase n=1 Tax=Acidisoma cellulosilyticum TaxID=2802395 RepID=A0A963YZ76_9PROT|nr:adenosylcobinamide-GDP ribazoletransferase [Acidisoma cellulosilyticum]MCB8879801.1 adenosylcobinamide-GDP ribazoletransferase [Acidisoma cellulosilyticum]
MAILGDLIAAFGLLTRLPLPKARSVSPMAAGVWAWPLAGLVVGLIGAAVYSLAWHWHLSPCLAALLSVIAMVIATGGFHEDGLADSADGIGGGATAERRLAIMKDSRIGSFGALALIASIGLRVGALAQIADPRFVFPALIVAGMAGRAAMPGVVLLSKPAKPGGLAAALGALDRKRVWGGWVIALLLSLLALHGHHLLPVIVVTMILVLAMVALGRRMLGGYTGDTLGATEQLTECAVLLVLASAS